jgi:hypothetical protein
MVISIIPSPLSEKTSTTSTQMKPQSELNETRLERLILGAAVTCVVAMAYLLITSLVG